MLEFHGAYEDSKNVYLVMELCEEGDITDVFNRYGGTFMENETRLLIKQILQALSVCHRNNILHRDLKMENFIFAVKGDVRSIRLIDFGLSEFIKPSEYLDYPAGSPDYIAPEVFDGFAGYESDCWSVGVIAYFLLVKKFPSEQGLHFSETDIDTWRPDISQGPDFSDRTWLLVPREARDLVKGLLQPDPKLRLTVREALRHEYFNGKWA
ncbi:hypothetical protein LUZ60_011418 [Juncus effusus]|nr:hypothetical protein LUZ60_011418 [Juncus effusus]